MNRIVIALLHCVYWASYGLLLAVLFGLMLNIISRNVSMPISVMRFSPQFKMVILLMSVTAVIPAIGAFYSSYTFLTTRFLQKHRYAFLVCIGASIYAALTIFTLLILQLLGLIDSTQLFKGAHWEMPFMLFLLAAGHGILGLFMRGFIAWFEESRMKAELQEKNTRMELDFIKAQLDPHFLFNTLNNIDVLIERDSVRASAYLQQLSAMMRFLLYETKVATMPLSTEIAYIEQYLDLQKIRTINRDFVRFEVLGDASAWNLAPMLFLPFIENAFKFAPRTKQETAITITFQIEQHEVVFECTNLTSKMQSDVQSNYTTHSGLGKSLIERRLQLLYPETHSLRITTEAEKYHVYLRLEKP